MFISHFGVLSTTLLQVSERLVFPFLRRITVLMSAKSPKQFPGGPNFFLKSLELGFPIDFGYVSSRFLTWIEIALIMRLSAQVCAAIRIIPLPRTSRGEPRAATGH